MVKMLNTRGSSRIKLIIHSIVCKFDNESVNSMFPCTHSLRIYLVSLSFLFEKGTGSIPRLVYTGSSVLFHSKYIICFERNFSWKYP